jgi:hypothetical protein
MLYDVDVHPDGRVLHQHVDHVYFARVPEREIDPDGHDEEDPGAWTWYTAGELRACDADPDTTRLGTEAIEAVRDAGS